MRKYLAAPFEAMHVFGVACFFAIAVALTLLTAPDWLAKFGKIDPDSAARHFNEIASLIGRNGLWVACIALACGAIAPYARADGKKTIAWVRVGCMAIAAVIVLFAWGRFESLPKVLDGGRASAADFTKWRSDKRPTPWNGLLLATGINLALAAFQVTGGAAKKPKGDGGGH